MHCKQCTLNCELSHSFSDALQDSKVVVQPSGSKTMALTDGLARSRRPTDGMWCYDFTSVCASGQWPVSNVRLLCLAWGRGALPCFCFAGGTCASSASAAASASASESVPTSRSASASASATFAFPAAPSQTGAAAALFLCKKRRTRL